MNIYWKSLVSFKFDKNISMKLSENKFNKNKLQLFFSQIKGKITEINFDDKYSNITIEVGHSNPRIVNLVAKTTNFNEIVSGLKIGDKIVAKFYISSKKKNDRYYTTATILEAQKQSTID